MNDQRRYVKIAPETLVIVGSLAGVNAPHPHIPDAWTGSSCMACFAPCDAPQHLARPYAALRRIGKPRSRHTPSYLPVRVPENTGKHHGRSPRNGMNPVIDKPTGHLIPAKLAR